MNAVRIVRHRTRQFWLSLHHAWIRVRRDEHRVVAKAAVVGHLSYYGLVFVESHGLYGKAAFVCGVLLLVEVTMGGGKHED